MNRWFIMLLSLLPCLSASAEQLPVEKIPAEKVDIVLLQDESGSMEKTDPFGVRRLAAAFLVDNLRIAGEGNTIGLVLFGTAAEKKVDLSRDFKAIKGHSKKGLIYRRPGPQAYLSLETTPLRDYTDIFGALKPSYEILSKSSEKVVIEGEEYSKQKYVLILTDGKIDPWPGHLDRYGDIARDFLDQAEKMAPVERFRFGQRRYKDRVAAIDKERIQREIIDRFKEKGWRIYAVGFTDGVDKELLKELAFGTYGSWGIARDYRELAKILEEVIPRAENVIPLLVEDFCETRYAAGKVNIGGDIDAALFKVDFSKMLEKEDMLVKADKLLITLTDPQGGQIRSDREAFFTFNTDKKDRVFTVTYYKENPLPGPWKVEIRGIGRDVCGKLEIQGRRKQFARITLVPESEEYWEGSDVNVLALIVGEGGENLPIEKVEGEVRLPSRDTFPINFGRPSANNVAEAKVKLNRGPGEYFLKVAITDGKYRTRIHKDKVIRVVPAEYCTPTVQPDSIDLGAVGDKRMSAPSEGIRVYCGDFPKSVPIKVKKPVLERGIVSIPIYWIKLRPEEGIITRESPFNFRLQLDLPGEIPPDIKDGVYKGYIKLESSFFKSPLEIPVEVEIKLSEIIIKGSERLDKLRFSFRLMLGKPTEETIEVATSSVRDREVTLTLSPNIKSINGSNEERIEVLFAKGDSLKTKVLARAGEFHKVKLKARLLETRLEPGIRIPPGVYTTELKVRGSLMRELRLPVEIEIPEKPFIIALRKILLIACFIPLVLVIYLSGKLKKLGGKHLFEGVIDVEITPFHIELGGKVLTFSRRTGQDAYTVILDSDGGYLDGEKIGREEPKLLEPGSMIEIGDRRERKSYYRCRIGRVSERGLLLRLVRSPYGSKGGFFLTRIMGWGLLLCVLLGTTVWAFHTI